jgi:glycosyltransferase involved in cell wall biosynthesis
MLVRTMDVSVIICTYAMERYDAFHEAVESVRAQTYDDLELVLVVDGNDSVADRAREDFGDDPAVTIHCNDQNVGNLQSINNGIELADGEIIANIDDDATAAPDWIEKLVTAYEEEDALAAGGRIEPDWVAGQADYIPEEFYWLIGATHRGFQDEPGEVRNTFGSNLSFRRDVVEALGGYPTAEEGRDSRFQAGETELCARLNREYDRGVYYVPDAVVYHKIFDYRTEPKWLLERAFWQGVSKRWMEVTHPDATGDDRDYLSDLLLKFVPSRVRNLVSSPSKPAFLQLVFLWCLLGATGLGYGYGVVRGVGSETA